MTCKKLYIIFIYSIYLFSVKRSCIKSMRLKIKTEFQCVYHEIKYLDIS